MQSPHTEVAVQPETRNHQGYFLPEETFFLVEETSSGWARICSHAHDDGYTSCHLVNPDDLQLLRK